jgi:hypothetical protein
MKFDDAIKELMNGASITRKPWHGQIYFKFDTANGKQGIHCYQPKLIHYVYNEDIMASDGWIVEGVDDKEWMFYDIIQFLKDGRKARLHDWSKETYIYYDPSAQLLVYYSMDIFPYTPGFDSFMAQDWMIIE